MAFPLDSLPNDTLKEVIDKLALKDRLRMSQVSRKFRALVDVSVLPITDNVRLDMVNEFFEVSASGKGTYRLINETREKNMKLLERRTNRTQNERRYCSREMLVCCRGGQWSATVERYLTRMRRHYCQEPLGSFHITVPETGDFDISPALFGIKFESVTLQQSPPSGHPLFPVPGEGEYDRVKRGKLTLHSDSVRPLPDNVYKWIEATTITSFSTNYALPPSVFDRIPCETFKGWLTLESAAHLLERFNGGFLKRAKRWLLMVAGDPKEVFEALVDGYGEHGEVIRYIDTSLVFPKNAAFNEMKLLVRLPTPYGSCNCVKIATEYASDELEDLEALAEIQEMLPEEKRRKKYNRFHLL